MKSWAGAKYGFLAPPRSSNEPRPPPDGSRYSSAFPVKYLGSGPVQHYTDYEGCLQVMNKQLTSYQLNNRRRMRRRSREDGYTELIVTFTPKRLFIVNKNSQVLEEMCRLESVYLVHPHPTRDRLFGLLTDNWMSGTLHCSVYVTLDHTTGSDVLYGFRKACRIWTDLKQSPPPPELTNQTTASVEASSETEAPLESSNQQPALSSMPSGEYDRLEHKTNETPTGVLVSLSESTLSLCSIESDRAVLNSDLRSLSLSQDSSSIDSNLKPLLYSQDSSTCDRKELSQASTELRSSLYSSSSASESTPLLHGLGESRLRLFSEGSISTQGDSKPLLCVTSTNSGLKSGEQMDSNTSTESKSLSVRRVSFAPSVVTSEVSVAKEEETLGSKLISNLNSLKSMVAGKSSLFYTPPHYPRLFPREYPPPPSPSDESQPHTSHNSQPHSSKVCSDLIDLHSEPSFKAVDTDSSQEVKETNSLSRFHTLSLDSLQRIGRCSSSPAMLTRSEGWNSTNSFTVVPESTQQSKMSVCDSNMYSSSFLSSLTSSLSSLTSSSVQGESSSSLHRSIHQLLTMSSLDHSSEWTSDSTLSSTQGTLKLKEPPCSGFNTTANGHEDLDEKLSENEGSSIVCRWSPDPPSSNRFEFETTLAKKEQAIQTEMANSHSDEDSSSSSTLALLFKNLASETSRVSSEFSALQRLLSTEGSDISWDTLAKLFEQQASQSSSDGSSTWSGSALANLFKTEQGSQTSTTTGVSSSRWSGAELARLFKEQASQTSANASTKWSGADLARLFKEQASQTSTQLSEGTLPRLFANTRSAPPLSQQSSTSAANPELSKSQASTAGWSDAKLPNIVASGESIPVSSGESLKELSPTLPAALLSLTQSALCTSFTVNASKVIDLPSLMETLRHVTSLLASSHAILDLSLATLKEKLQAQPSNVCVCTCQQGGEKDEKRSSTEDAGVSQSEPMLTQSS